MSSQAPYSAPGKDIPEPSAHGLTDGEGQTGSQSFAAQGHSGAALGLQGGTAAPVRGLNTEHLGVDR